jgi:endonuclease/exonuclease/phosphatase family metal-dependent hydrolase
MNNELPSEKPSQQQRSLDECFADKPHMRQRLLEISDMIDTLVAQGCTAHEAEAKAIEQIRKLGNGILTEWAEKSEAAAAAKARAGNPELRSYRKKNS